MRWAISSRWSLGWLIAARLVRSDRLWGGLPRPSRESLDDLLVFVAFGAVLGGRTAYVLFYNLPISSHIPLEIPAVWKGGMAFHGGLAGAALGAWLFARREKAPLPRVGDLVLRRGADRPVPRAHRQFHQAGALGPPDRRSLGDGLSRRRARSRATRASFTKPASKGSCSA